MYSLLNPSNPCPMHVHLFIGEGHGMSWLDRLLGRNETSGQVVQRLQMAPHPRSRRSAAGSAGADQDDIVQVIAKHTAIDTDKVEGHLEQDSRQNRLVAEIPLATVRARRNGDGR